MEHIQLWENYKNNPTPENEAEIIGKINEELITCVEYFTEYYRNPQNLVKFIKESNIDLLIEGINKVKVITYLNPHNKELDSAWGYIYTNDLFTIHINYFSFFNHTINASTYDTILHEMGHLIDFQLRKLKEDPSYLEFGHIRPKNRPDKYIVSREEDYARIQRLRNIFKLNPIGTYQELADVFHSYIKDNRIELLKLPISVSEDKKSIIVEIGKDLPNLTLSDLAYLFGNIVIDGYLATDIGYLFAKYSKIAKTTIEVDILKINNINNQFVNKGFDGSSNNFV